MTENVNDSASRSFDLDDVCLTPQQQIGLHEQPTWELVYIVLGEGMKQIGGQTEPFRSGEVVLIPPEIPHCWHFDRNVTDSRGRIANVILTFTDDFLDRLARDFPEIRPHVEKLRQRRDALKFGKPEANALIALLQEMRDKEPAHRLAPMISLLIRIAEDDRPRTVGRRPQADREQKRLKQIDIFILCNLKQGITIDDVARHVGMNRTAFCIFFKRATGKTFITYLNEHRIELACQLLAQQQMTVSEICYHVGFNNVPYFNRVFKRLKGVAPTQLSRFANREETPKKHLRSIVPETGRNSDNPSEAASGAGADVSR